MADEFMSVLLVVPPVALVASGHVHGSRAPGGKRIASGSHQNLRAAFTRVWERMVVPGGSRLCYIRLCNSFCACIEELVAPFFWHHPAWVVQHCGSRLCYLWRLYVA